MIILSTTQIAIRISRTYTDHCLDCDSNTYLYYDIVVTLMYVVL